MRAYWLGLIYALLSASISYVTANGLSPQPPKTETAKPKTEQDYRDWYNRDRMSGSFTLNRTAGNLLLAEVGSRRRSV